jgi:hypothetical protein
MKIQASYGETSLLLPLPATLVLFFANCKWAAQQLQETSHESMMK